MLTSLSLIGSFESFEFELMISLFIVSAGLLLILFGFIFLLLLYIDLLLATERLLCDDLSKFNRRQTQVVLFKLVIRVISSRDKRLSKKTDLKLVRNCFDINPYNTKPMAALISANRSITSPKRL